MGGLFVAERSGEMAPEEWYSNKQLYEMMVDLSKRLETTNAELSKTQTMIRDYNGLRERIDDCEKKVSQIAGQRTGGKDMWGYAVGAIGLIMALITAIAR
jgi:tetrahydromethanopterin S-methyltransferase subunit G